MKKNTLPNSSHPVTAVFEVRQWHHNRSHLLACAPLRLSCTLEWKASTKISKVYVFMHFAFSFGSWNRTQFHQNSRPLSAEPYHKPTLKSWTPSFDRDTRSLEHIITRRRKTNVKSCGKTLSRMSITWFLMFFLLRLSVSRVILVFGVVAIVVANVPPFHTRETHIHTHTRHLSFRATSRAFHFSLFSSCYSGVG